MTTMMSLRIEIVMGTVFANYISNGLLTSAVRLKFNVELKDGIF